MDFQNGGTLYSYDGSGLRVKKVTGGNTTIYVFSGTLPIAEYVNGTLTKEYVYAADQLLATYDAGTAGGPLMGRVEKLSSLRTLRVPHSFARFSRMSGGERVGRIDFPDAERVEAAFAHSTKTALSGAPSGFSTLPTAEVS